VKEVKDFFNAKPDRRLRRDAEEEEGKMLEPPKNNKGIAMEWQELQKRARTDESTMLGGMLTIASYIGPSVVHPSMGGSCEARRYLYTGMYI
jgi:hypothetical protein